MTSPVSPVERTATISDCGRYRYELGRRWSDEPVLAFVMLNPSTADADVDDPTIRRCIGFAKREGAGGIHVVNLWALRATDPKALRSSHDPIGPANLDLLRNTVALSDRIVAAWGAWYGPTTEPVAILLSAAERTGRHLECLGQTKHGAPRHPLYVKADQPLEVFR